MVKTSPFENLRVRVMDGSWTDFKKFEETNSPIKLSNVNPTKTCTFYNKMSTVNVVKKLNFDKHEDINLSVREIYSKLPDGMISIKGHIDWLCSSRIVNVAETLRCVRDAEFTDSTKKSITISIWGELIDKISPGATYELKNVAARRYNNQLQLTTTVETIIVNRLSDDQKTGDDNDDDDAAYEYSSNETLETICCPEIKATKIDYFIFCNSCSSKKKITKTDGDAIIHCLNCDSSMKQSRCTKVSQIKITVSKDEKLVVLTLLPKRHEDPEETKRKLLLLENASLTSDRCRT